MLILYIIYKRFQYLQILVFKEIFGIIFRVFLRLIVFVGEWDI